MLLGGAEQKSTGTIRRANSDLGRGVNPLRRDSTHATPLSIGHSAYSAGEAMRRDSRVLRDNCSSRNNNLDTGSDEMTSDTRLCFPSANWRA
jgi:hypothetical protein